MNDILVAFGDRAFGALMLFFAAPNMLPLPPGTSSVLGLPLLFITAQLMLGRSVLWMPDRILHKRFLKEDFRRIAERLARWLRPLERILKIRLTFLLGDRQDRIIGGIGLVLAAILFLPIPFGNMLPAFALSMFALGLSARDGLFIIFGGLATMASLLTLAAVSAALLAAAKAFIDYFRAFF